MFSIRIFSVDHYMSSPILGLDPTYSHFRGKEVKQVPVLRIFGANKTGHKTCLHVHGVFPYLHIPHDETSLESTEKLCYRVATSLDKAINILMGQSDSTTQHVFDVTPVAGVPLYGYHNRKHQFLKIRFFNPFSIKKAATLFQNGTILDRIYQPHDAHINYELQFMIDFNLHGMNNIYLSDIKYRIDEKIDSSIIDDIPSQQILNKNITRISTCKYEIDCLCESILNLQEVTNGKLSTNPGIAAIWEEERHRRQLQNKNTQDIAPTASQFRTKLTETNSEIFFKNRLRDRLETIKNSNVSSVPPLNQSIYPSEVSDPNQFLNASIAHLMQNPELSFTPIEKSDSIVNESLILSLTQEAKKPNKPIIDDIYNALIDLIDEDSILSQHPLNEHAVALEDEIEQESHDLEQTLVEENEMFSLNQKENQSTEFESEVINEIFSSNDSFMKHVNVSQLEQNIEVHLEHTDLDNFSEDTVIESEKQYSIFYDDILEMKKTQLKSTELTFSQFSNDTLDSVIENEIEKIEKSHNEESIIYSSDSDELIFDGEWKRIPQIDGATKDLKEKPKRKSRLSKSNKPEIFREILCEYTGMIYKIEPVIEPKLPKKKLGRQKSKNTKEQKKPTVKVLKVEKNNLNVEDLTKSINYMPVPLQDIKMPVSLEDVKPNNTVLLSMPIIDEQYDELLKDFDHFLSQSTFTNSNFASQNEVYKIYPPNELNTTYSKPESSDDSIIMPPVDVIIKQDLDSTFTIKNECIDSKQSINFESYIEPKSFNIKTTQVIKSEPLIKNETILQRPNDETYINQEPSHIFMDDFLNCTFVINDNNLPSIKGLISEMINAIAPNETFEIYPESSCNLYHEMNAIISGKTTMVDISCRFLQNVRECHYRKILNSEQTSDVPYILRLNRNLEPIAIDTCDENQFPTTKYTIDKNKFIKSIIYDNSWEITDKHTIYCKNGKIVIEENLFDDNQKSPYEHYTNWEKVKFNIKEGRPWNSTKDSLKKQVKKVHSSPKIVTSKPFDSKLRDFITNNNTFNVQNKTNENIPLIKKSIKLGEKNIDEFKDEITNENQCKDFKKQDKSTKKESKLNNLKNNSESKSKEINLELKNNLNIDDKIENQCVSENRITQKIDSVVKNTNDILKKFESENKISEKKLKLKHLQNNDEISEKVKCGNIEKPKNFLKKFESENKIKEIESKAAYEDRTSNEIICKIPLNLIPQKVFENLKNDKLLIDTINLASSSSTLIQERLLNKENQVLLKNNIKSAKSKWSKSSKKLNQSKKLKQVRMIFERKRKIRQFKNMTKKFKQLLQQKIRKHFEMESNSNSTFTKEITNLETFISHRIIKKIENKLIISVNNYDSMCTNKIYNIPRKTLNERWNDSIAAGLFEIENFISTKSSNSKPKKELLKHSLYLNENEEGFVKNYPIAQSSPNKQQYKNENNVTKLVTNENNTGTRKDRTKKKNVLSNDYQMNLQKNTETFAQDKIENHVKEFNLKEILSENVTHSSPDMIETVKYLEKIETPLENNKTEQNHAILQLITKKKDSKKSSETVTLSSVEEVKYIEKIEKHKKNQDLEILQPITKKKASKKLSLGNKFGKLEELATELNVRSENNIDNASNHVSDYLNLTSFENKQATRNKFSKGKRKTIQFSKTKKSVEMNSSQNISENGETLLSTSNSVQFMKKSEMPLKKQIQKKRIIRKSTIERLIEDNDCSNISENEPRRLRSMQKSSNVRVFFKNLEINKNLENHKTSNDDNKMIEIEEFTTVLNENSTENNDSSLIDTKSDHSNLSAEQVSKSYDIELSPTIKSSTSKCKTLKTEKKINSDGLNSHKKMVQFNSGPDLTENGENCCMISMANIDNPNPVESMEKIEINVQFPKEEHNTIVKSKCTKQLKDLKVFVENLEIHENSAKNQLNNVNLNLKSPVDMFSNTSDHQNGLMKDAFEQEPSTSKYLQSKLRNNLENISLNNINLDTKSSIDIVLNTSDSRKGLTGEISKSFEKEQLKNVQKKRKKRNPYTRRRKIKKTVKINCHDSITDGLNLGKSIRTSSESKKFEKLEELKRNAKTCDIEPQDKMTNESVSLKESCSLFNTEKKINEENLKKSKNIKNQSVLNKEMNTLEDRIVQRPVRQAKLNACKNIQNFSILFGVHSRRLDFKQNRETNLNNIPTSTVNHIEENLDQLQNQKENLPLKTYLPKSSQENMEVLEQNLSNYENIPGIDGTLDVLLTTSSDDSSTDSSGDDHVDILFVDGLNNEQSIREKYSLRECSVVLSRFDATKNEQVKQEKQEISIKRKLRSQSRVMTPNKIIGTSQQCSFVPLDIAFTKSPTSRNLKDNEKQRRAKKRLKFDNQQSYSNETTAELQNIEDNFKDKNFQSASEIEEILPQSVGGELIQQHFESQSLDSSESEKTKKLYQRKEINLKKNKNNYLYNNQNDMNNVIQNSCDNSSDLVNNSISDKNRRRSLRNRTLLSETKKIAKHSTNISKPSTSIGKIVPETSINSNRTYVEENTGCVFSPKSTKKLSLINLSQVPLQDEADAAMGQFKNCSPEIESDDSITIPNPTEINRENISPSPEHEIQLLISPRKTQKNYSNAFEYDLKNKYFPQPGCSTTKGDNLASESHPGEKITNLCENETSQSLLFENNEKLPQTQVSECDVESFYDITFGDCTKLDEDDLVSNSKSNSSFHCAQNINEFDQKPSQSTEMQLSGLSFQSDQILTQTPNEKLNILNLSTIEFGKGVKRLTNGYVILMPKFNPPSYDDIKNSAAEYNIPEVQYENPFYSVPTDATGRIEIGHKILKIPTKIVQDLSEFTSNLEFDALNVWRQRKIDNMHVNGGQNFASNREILITPNIKPPSLKDIEVWLKAKNYLKDVKPKRDESVKIKIRIPSSPGGGGNDSDDSDSLTLTPCTPRNESIQTPIDISINTPKSAQNSTILTLDNFSNTPKTTQIGQSPSMIHKGTKHILKNKRVKVALAKSFNKPQENENLLDPSVANLLNDPQFRKDLNSPLSNSSCLITGVTLDNTHGFKVPLENFQDVKAMIKYQYLTTVILELHIKNREDFKPNPRLDPIVAIFYSIYNDVPENFELPQSETGVICVGSNDFLMGTCTSNIKITYVESELQLFDKLIELFTKWDPDILAGYEIGRLSWGYLLERSFHLQLNLPKRLSRIPESRANTRIDENGQMSDLNFTGRLFLEIWRLMRHEINLYSYSFENIYFHILHERIPKHSFRNLSTWFESTRNRYITVQYYLKRVTGVLSILDQLDFIGRTSELARLFGIQFYEVLSRGSQFRVESMMLRLTKPLNYIPVTPSVTQRAKMKAPEFLPLIMEPDSRLYNDPIIVLDFQSLYPSMIIAYNYCFSTCLGRVSELGQSHPFEFGATQLRVNPKLVEAYLNNNKLNISPCGVAFVNDSVRQGILPRMLKEILDCRLMVKKSLKENKDDATLKRVLNSRQLGLKLIANVTYGYTAANFSGRMPCCELGDSVVSKGRETLERAIQMVEKNEKWRAKVVYGDTDSLFVITPGRSRKDAFEIGKEIADAVTNDNPTPVKLKLEKIYQPCILQTKKRYVGYMYESPDQEEPVYNAKGIETVRRDGCPAVAKILEKTLRILFETKDMSMVKQYVCRQFSKIITGRINLQDLIFAREFRGLNGYRPGAMVPALEIAKRYKQQDPRSEPLRSERVPYVIASGAPGTTLVRLAKGPHELLSDPALKPHIQYYITKVIIPPLNRCLSLCGVDVHAWYKDLPRKYKLYFPTAETSSKDAKKTTIAQHFATASCASCETQTRDGICSNCINDPQKTVTILEDKLRKWERNLDNIRKICSSCCGRFEETQCTSLDCPVLYRLTQAERDCEQAPFVRELVNLKF